MAAAVDLSWQGLVQLLDYMDEAESKAFAKEQSRSDSSSSIGSCSNLELGTSLESAQRALRT